MGLKYEHLLGLEFDIEKQNCYDIIRHFYKDNYEIELPEIACPTDWWSNGLNLYAALSSPLGFSPVDTGPRTWQPGDVIVCALKSSIGNHGAVLLDNNKVLHHLVGQRSCVTPYGGMLRNNTVAVYRHKDVPVYRRDTQLVDLRTLLTPHARRKLEEFEAQLKAREDSQAGA